VAALPETPADRAAPNRAAPVPHRAAARQVPARRPARPAGAWGESAVVLSVVAVMCAAYYSFAHYGFDILEEGYFLANAQRVQAGDLPFRDFNAPYTPGVFYLYAWLMDHVGPNVVALRALQVLGRGVLVLALYAAGRQLVPPFFAALAPAVIMAMDTVPGMWSLHPGWYTAPLSILAVLGVTAYLKTGSARWLFLAGVASGGAFAFKQNLAAYGTIAALWLLVVCESQLPPLWRPHGRHQTLPRRQLRWAVVAARRVTQLAALFLLPATAAVIARPYMSPLVAALFVLPLAAVGVGAWAVVRRSAVREAEHGRWPFHGWQREAAFYARPAILLAGFGLVTLAWFIPFFKALDYRVDLLGPLVGKIDQTGYYLGMNPPTAAHVRAVLLALALPAALPVLGALGLWGRRGVALLLAAVAAWVAWVARQSHTWDDPWNAVDALADVRARLLAATGTLGDEVYTTPDLLLYLPTIAFWAGLAALLGRFRLRRNNLDLSFAATLGPQSAEPGPAGLLRLWYLVAGAALLLNQYPRMDEVHMLWSGGMLLVVGADVLRRWYRQAVQLAPRFATSAANRGALKLSLVALPAFAVVPMVTYRLDGAGPLFRPVATAEELTRPEGPYGLVRLSVEGDRSGLWLPGKEGLVYQKIADHLVAETAPGEPIFTYPAIPGFYYLANRPNATGFNHLFPGMASPAEQLEMVRQLERVNFIVWDDGGAHYWVHPGDNAPVTEYIRTNFRIELFVGPYAILSRRAVVNWGEPLPYFLP
jgi:hypothetical protein